MVPYCSCCLCLYFDSSIMLVTCFVNFRQLNDRLFGKELFILFAASAFRKLSSIYVFSYFPFGFEGRIWDLIVSVPDHYLSVYFVRFCSNLHHTLTIRQCMFGRKKGAEGSVLQVLDLCHFVVPTL